MIDTFPPDFDTVTDIHQFIPALPNTQVYVPKEGWLVVIGWVWRQHKHRKDGVFRSWATFDAVALGVNGAFVVEDKEVDFSTA